MKKLLFSILIVLGLFLVGCGKDNKDDGKENTLSAEDKSRPRIELQDVNFDGKTIKQIVVIPADEIEEKELFEKAIKSKEDFFDNFPNLTDKERTYNELTQYIEKNFLPNVVKFNINLENSWNTFIKNSNDLRKYLSDQEINDLLETVGKSVSEVQINHFNDLLQQKQI